jgi:hypothetical protein
MRRIASVMQLAGIATVSFGFGLIAVPAGVIVAGVGLFAVGLAEEVRSVR